MRWIHDYQLFLFDLDGLLVNTEEIHYTAYQRMCKGRGYELPWDFARYCQEAHYDSEKLKNSLYADIPELYREEPNWDVLYAEKKKAMLDLLNGGAVHMMPGAEKLLRALEAANISRCVVTHSPDEQIQIIKKQNPVLDSIPEWFTRESYSRPKPHPECYLNAITKLGKGAKRIVGFEDTPRGLRALIHTPVRPILVADVPYPEIPDFVERGVLHFDSLESLPENSLG